MLAQKYFRKAGVPAKLKRVEENSVPSFLWRSVADAEALRRRPRSSARPAKPARGKCSTDSRGAWTYWGWKGGYFDSGGRRAAFSDELRFMLAKQMAAPNSPQWFNTGLHWAYGVDGPARAIFTSITPMESSSNPKAHTNTRSRTPALSSRSPTIS